MKQIRDAFKSYPEAHVGSIATLKVFGEGSGLTPGGKTVTFVQNHDTERNGDALTYKDGARNTLATQWLLASGYGTPQVYAAFTFTTNDDSPPATADGMITDTDCGAAAWSCTDRDAGVLGMVGWHNYVGKARQQNWYDDGQNVIAFGRGAKGWVAFNNGARPRRSGSRPGWPQAPTVTSCTARSPAAPAPARRSRSVTAGPRSPSAPRTRWRSRPTVESDPGAGNAARQARGARKNLRAGPVDGRVSPPPARAWRRGPRASAGHPGRRTPAPVRRLGFAT